MIFLFRFLSLLALSAAIVAGALDAILSVSSTTVVLTSFAEDWRAINPAGLPLVQAFVEHYIHPQAWRRGVEVVIDLPASAVLLGFSLIFWMIGYRRPKPAYLMN
ncbi:hypothetical protein [Rhizobium sp. SSA_523]|uniref:hypothetical protein n=1 Tax=Rhizobium sp. SSA_523 TaxID=2952477 RepID=UPI0020907B38|nr:hypothetical protein [Rhizobium sp. SSA_523]MCO5732801.1 hypothetical protein [Rhizobium sp. SSA_523]WKC23581.1 hypothetical protein QTJ18_22750 [Rhizobium sp. SSA_523]